ncbi:MAG: hypothetical protein NVSMB68_10600 [Thermoanaerobaculia bacterium]
MTRTMIRFAVTFLALLQLSSPLPAAERHTAHVVLAIFGMHCASCATGIKSMLKRSDGVRQVDVSYAQRRATVDYDPAKTTAKKIIATVETMGYRASIKP